MDDRELLRKYIATGSEQAFTELVQRHADLVYSVCYRQLRDEHLAEDATQAAFIVLALKASSISEGISLGGWLFNVARFTSADVQKSRLRRARREEEASRMQQERQQTSTAEGLSHALDEALTRLGQKERDAILLRYVDGRTMREVAEVLHISVSAAEKRIERALSKLQNTLAGAGVVTSVAALASSLSVPGYNAPAELIASSVSTALAASKASSVIGQSYVIAQNAWKQILLAKVRAVAFVAITLVAMTAVSAGLVVYALESERRLPVAPHRETKAEAPGTAEREFVGELKCLDVGANAPRCVASIPGTKKFLTGGAMTPRVWDLQAGKEVLAFENSEPELICAVAVSADGKRAVSGNARGLVQAWDVATGKELQRFEGPPEQAITVVLSSDGRRILAATADEIMLWNAEDRKEVVRWQTGARLSCVAMTSDARKVVWGSSDGTIRICDATTGKVLRTSGEHKLRVSALKCAPGNTHFASGDEVGRIFFWALDTGKVLSRFNEHKTEVRALSFAADGKRLLSSAGGVDPFTVAPTVGGEMGSIHDCTVRLWELDQAKSSWCFEGHSNVVDGVAFSSDEKRAISVSSDIRIWSLPGGRRETK